MTVGGCGDSSRNASQVKVLLWGLGLCVSEGSNGGLEDAAGNRLGFWSLN